MNIFYLDKAPKVAAELHCDKHVVKMIIEYAQLMSTAHRILDGTEYMDKTANGRNIRRWLHENSNYENTLYKASHINHPSAKWTRESAYNYNYVYKLFCALCDEYTYRYGKVHMTDEKLRELLAMPPKNIPINRKFFQPPQAMPDDVKEECSIIAYQNYYRNYKKSFAKWTNRPVPAFMST